MNGFYTFLVQHEEPTYSLSVLDVLVFLFLAVMLFRAKRRSVFSRSSSCSLMDAGDKLQTNVISSGVIFNLPLLAHWMSHL